jgi:hypothetical protein
MRVPPRFGQAGTSCLITVMAIEKAKRTRLNEQWWPLMNMWQSKRLHTWHMYLSGAVVTPTSTFSLSQAEGKALA